MHGRSAQLMVLSLALVYSLLVFFTRYMHPFSTAAVAAARPLGSLVTVGGQPIELRGSLQVVGIDGVLVRFFDIVVGSAQSSAGW